MDITMKKIEGSSQLKAVGYNVKTRTLKIKFHNDAVYAYTPVPKITYDMLVIAPKPGEYFRDNIKNNKSITFKKI